MKQILQNFKTGKTELTEVPFPAAKTGHVLIQTKTSVISAGTERIADPQITPVPSPGATGQAQIFAD